MANHKYNTHLLVAQNVEMILQLYQNIIREFPNIQNFDCPPPPPLTTLTQQQFNPKILSSSHAEFWRTLSSYWWGKLFI